METRLNSSCQLCRGRAGSEGKRSATAGALVRAVRQRPTGPRGFVSIRLWHRTWPAIIDMRSVGVIQRRLHRLRAFCRIHRRVLRAGEVGTPRDVEIVWTEISGQMAIVASRGRSRFATGHRPRDRFFRLSRVLTRCLPRS